MIAINNYPHTFILFFDCSAISLKIVHALFFVNELYVWILMITLSFFMIAKHVNNRE